MSLPSKSGRRKPQQPKDVEVRQQGEFELPDVFGLSNADAAQMYAKAGLHVLPIKPGTKNPGSYLGHGWPARASNDLDTVRDWWRRWPGAGIAIHVGGSELLVIDVDRPELIPEWMWPHLERAVFRATTNDQSSRRGHYFYRLRPEQVFGCGRGRLKPPNGKPAGFDIKCGGGAIVLGPSDHPRAAEGGQYATGPVGTLALVPDEIAAKLNGPADGDSGWRMLTPIELDDKAKAFLERYTDEDQPAALEPILRSFNTEPGERHPTMFDELCWAMREAKAQRFSAQRAADELRELWTQAAPGREDDFNRALRDAIARADADGTVDELRARADGFASMEAWRGAQEAFGNWAPVIDEPASEVGPVTRSLAGVTPTQVNWLWRGWVPLGKVTILEGEPEEGKSVMTLDWAAIVTQGREWPLTTIGDEPLPRDKADPADVVLVGVEDDLEDTVVPRLDAAVADRSRVHIINQPLDDNGNPKPFLIPDGVDRLRMAIVATGAQLVVIDPITAFLSTKQAKAGDDPSTRQALMPLVILAAETGCAIVLVRHLNKATGMSAKHRGSGTIAYTGIARSVIVAGELKELKQDGPTHALALTKGNLTKRPQAIGYRLDSAPIDHDSPVVTWFGPLDITADQIVGADGAKVGDARKTAPVRDECERVLRELLADGPMPMKEAIQKTRDAVGCGPGSVHDAAKRLGVVKKPVRQGGGIDHWTWELPPEKIRLFNEDGGENDLEGPTP